MARRYYSTSKGMYGVRDTKARTARLVGKADRAKAARNIKRRKSSGGGGG